jgi:hypothetical protein
MMARWKRPAAGGDATFAAAETAPGGLAADRDIVGVAAKSSNILLHPAQRRLLIHQTIIGKGMAFGLQCRMGEKAQEAQPVVDRDDDRRAQRAAQGELARVVIVALAVEPSAAVNPQQDRILLSPVTVGTSSDIRREDIEIEAVLRGAGRAGIYPQFEILRAGIGKGRRVQRLLPWSRRLGRHPAQWADRGSGVRDAEKFVHPVFDKPSHRAVMCPDQRTAVPIRPHCWKRNRSCCEQGAEHDKSASEFLPDARGKGDIRFLCHGLSSQ